MRDIPIFIASSIVEFKDERTELLSYLGTLNKLYKRRGIRLEWDNPEDMSHAMRPDGSQSEIDEAIRACDFFFVIVGRDMGQYTRGEFETAWEQFQTTGKPKIYTYFLPPLYEFTQKSVEEFRDRLKELKHYYKVCRGMSEIKLEMQIEFFRNIDFGARAEPSSDEETAQKGQDAARKLIFKQRDKIRTLTAKSVTPQVIAELTDAYEELRRLVQTYKVEPDTLLDYMYFLWQQHLYDTGIQLGHWLENFYRMEPSGDDTLSSLKSLLGICYHESKQYDRAEEYYKEALNIDRSLASENPDFEAWVAGTCGNLGNLFTVHSANRPEEAERYYQEALEIRQRLAKANPADYEPYVACTCNNLGILLSDTSRPEEAEQYLQQALEIYQRLAEANPAAYEPNLAQICNNLAYLFIVADKMEVPVSPEQIAKAEPYLQRALKIRRRYVKANPKAYKFYMATTLYNFGVLEYKRNQPDAARLYFEEALAIFEEYPHCAEEVQKCRDALAKL